MARGRKLSPRTRDILLMVGTVKGAFIFLADAGRASFEMSGPHFPGPIGVVGGLYS